MSKPNILVQFDADPQASTFDAVVAIDSGVAQLLQYRGVQPQDVRGLVHGCMFTRGPSDLRHTAIFIGGSNVAAAEALLAETTKCFFGPMRVSVMLDANGANTTAAAAVLAASKHVDLKSATAVVLGGTGPVGQRVARLLAREGSVVRLASRNAERARAACAAIQSHVPNAAISPASGDDPVSLAALLNGAALVISAGAAGAELLPAQTRQQARSLRVAIDLNAVPPVGLGGVDVMDKATLRDGVPCYGAIGVGGTKMKIHKAALAQLFTANTHVLNAEEILAIGKTLG